MKQLFLATLVFIFGFILSASAQKKIKLNHVVKNISGKYKSLNAKAPYVTANGVSIARETRFIQPEDKVVTEYGNLRQIALIRHGEPDLLKTGRFSYAQAKQFLKNYDSVRIVTPDKPFFKIEHPDEVAIFTSSITRAQATAQYLFGDSAKMVVSPDFREFETTVGKYSPKFRMPIKLWTTSARIKWLLGIDGGGIETFAEAKRRAGKAARLLADATREKPKVVLVAHGFLNRFIKENLEKMGWHVVRDGGSNYFATTILVKIEDRKKEENQISSDTRQ